MKTVTTINLNGRAYQVEEEAHKALAAYLEKATIALSDNPDRDEILADFEQAIAEKCSRYLTPAKNVILLKEIETIISEMGRVEGMDTEPKSGDGENKTGAQEKPKRLYRDPDNRVIAGVASGLAQYFDIDPAIVRIIFVVSIFIGGTGILVYIVLWLAVPEAETTAQKLEMRGSHVSLSSMAEMLREKIEKVKPSKSTWNSATKAPLGVLRGIGSLIQDGILPAVRGIFGLIFMCIGFIGAIALTIAIGTALFVAPTSFSDFATLTTMTGTIFFVALIAGYLVVFIPLACIFFAGLGIMQKKNLVKGGLGMSFLILWFLAIIVGGITTAKTVLQAERSMTTDSAFQRVQESIAMDAFTKLEVLNGQTVSYVAGDMYSITMDGQRRDLDTMKFETKDGVLSIDQESGLHRGCFIFCFPRKQVLVTVTAPLLSDVTLKNGSVFEGALITDTGVLVLKNASRATVTGTTKNMLVTLENASKINITGTSETLTLNLKNASRFNGNLFVVQSADVHAQNASHAEVSAIQTLTVTAENGSNIEYQGSPNIQKNLKNGSSLKKTD